MSLLEALNKKKQQLNQTTTRVTLANGKVFQEKRSNDRQVLVEAQKTITIPQGQGSVALCSYLWDTDSNAWLQLTPNTQFDASSRHDIAGLDGDAAAVEALRCMTFNVWFAEEDFEARAHALFSCLAQSKAHIVCLQEVTPRLMNLLCQNDFIRHHYVLSDDADGGSVQPDGVLVLLARCLLAHTRQHPALSHTFRLHRIPSSMRRRALILDLELSLSKPHPLVLRVATTHLESLHNTETRIEQLYAMIKLLAAPSSLSENGAHVLWMGDFNFSDCSPEQPHLNQAAPSYLDVWKHLCPPVRPSTLRGGHGRYDRILVQSAQVRATSIHLVGDQPDPIHGVYPSDHFGLLASFQIDSSPPPIVETAPSQSVQPHTQQPIVEQPQSAPRNMGHPNAENEEKRDSDKCITM